MKAKYALFLVVLGFCIDFIGGVFKIMHRANGDTLLILAAVCKITGVLLLFFKVVNYQRFRDFLND